MPKLLLRGKPIGTIKGVLFDKDGTLSYSEDHLADIAAARIQEAIKLFRNGTANQNEVSKLQSLLKDAYGIKPEGLNPGGTLAVASRYQNLISTATILCVLGEDWPKAQELAEEIFQKVDSPKNNSHKSIKERLLLPGVHNVLQSFHQSGIICALISNDTNSGIKNFLLKNNLETIITNFWSAENQPTKPDPAAVHNLCKILSINPRDCALIGDADSDLKMARKAGIELTLGYTAGWTQKPNLSAHQHLIHNWDELTVQQNPKVLSKISYL